MLEAMASAVGMHKAHHMHGLYPSRGMMKTIRTPPVLKLPQSQNSPSPKRHQGFWTSWESKGRLYLKLWCMVYGVQSWSFGSGSGEKL